VRTRGAGAYQFSLDDETRQKQMASLDAERLETEMARDRTAKRGTMSVAQEVKRRRLADRRAVIEAKREQLLGGKANLTRLRADKRTKDTDAFFAEIEEDVWRSTSPIKRG
jgi:large subunit ribosomal protein L24e